MENLAWLHVKPYIVNWTGKYPRVTKVGTNFKIRHISAVGTLDTDDNSIIWWWATRTPENGTYLGRDCIFHKLTLLWDAHPSPKLLRLYGKATFNKHTAFSLRQNIIGLTVNIIYPRANKPRNWTLVRAKIGAVERTRGGVVHPGPRIREVCVLPSPGEGMRDLHTRFLM